jgi:hypothetical protein
MTKTRTMVPIRDVAIRLGQSYGQAYNQALRGAFGAPQLIGRRIYVPLEAVERAAAADAGCELAVEL